MALLSRSGTDLSAGIPVALEPDSWTGRQSRHSAHREILQAGSGQTGGQRMAAASQPVLVRA